MISTVTLLFALLLAGDGQCQHEPLSIVRVNSYYDGGTVAVSVSDSSGCLVSFCFDYSLSSETRGRVYMSPGGPRHPEARITGLKEERGIVKLLQGVIDHHYPRLVQQEIVKKEFRKVAFTERDAWTLLRVLREWNESDDR